MEDKLEKSIKALCEKSSNAESAIEAQQYAQAVSNLTQALIGIRDFPRQKR